MANAKASELVRNHLQGFWKAQVVSAAASLGLADHMGDAPNDAATLAAKLQADAGSLYRLLRAMASLGLVTHEADDRFTITDAGRCLRTGVDGSLRGMALHVGTMLAPAFCKLAESVRSGKPPEGIKFGPEGFAELNDVPDAAHIFNQSMVDGSRRVADLANAAYDFSRFGTVMDVGGGYGAVLAGILKNHPAMRGSVLDLEHAKQGAEAYFVAEGVAGRAQFTTGSFFEPITEDADCYVLKYIIHDWNDGYARQIMAQVGTAARRSNGTVVLIERVLPERIEARDDHAGAIQGDLTMMLWDGKERTEVEYRALFEGAGLSLTRIVPIGDGFDVIEGKPA